MNRIQTALLVAALAFASSADAAPAPFPRTTGNDEPVTVEHIKQQLLREHNFFADGIESNGGTNEWIVKGNTPTFVEGRMMYRQQYYQVTVTGTDRRGKLKLTLNNLPSPRRWAITR